jgi:4-amino-4-deoxy-L-arabinose transferase-like glycosyltransferase
MTVHSNKLDISGVKKYLLRVDAWLVAVLVCFTFLAWAYWGKMEYPIIDIGREVEIPARIADGQLLYRDAATYYGPLAYYANAIALLLLGHHLEVFYLVGLSLALAITLLFYRLAKRLMNARWAALCTGCMLIYCAFSVDMFNFILPYSYGGVYGMVLCLLAITFVDYYTCKGQLGWLIAAAIACGLAGLAKQEYGVAVLASVLVGTNLYFPQSLQTRVRHTGLLLVVSGLCVILPLILLTKQVSWQELYLSLFPTQQLSILNRSNLFQTSPFKTLYIWISTFKLFFAGSLMVLVSVVAAHWLLKYRWMNTFGKLKPIVEVLAGFVFAWMSLKLLSVTASINLFHPLSNLSWCIPALIGWFGLAWSKLSRYKHSQLLWTLLIFSVLLNSRWLFSIGFYGLYAPPVILLFFTVFYYLTPSNDGMVWRYLLVCLLVSSSLNVHWLEQYRYAVTSPYGTFYTRKASLASAFNQTIKAIKDAGASSVLVLPEGNILNFLTNTHSPSQQLTFLPPVLPTSKEEQEFVAHMKAKPPELIVYVPRSFPEWGYQNYAEFNPLVDRWITHQHKLTNVFHMDDGDIRIYN